MRAYQVQILDCVVDEAGRERAMDINDDDCIVQVSRRGDLEVIARAMLRLGMELGAAGVTILPIVGLTENL